MRKFFASIATLALASTAFGQAAWNCPEALDYPGFDDGGSERIWKVSNPSGPSEWFNVDFDNSLMGRTIVAVAPAFDESNANKGPSWAKVGIYPDNLTVSSLGFTPDINAPIQEVTSGTVILNNNCNFNPFIIPTTNLTFATNVHVAFQHTPGDSSMWLCSDTSSTPAGRSYFSSTGYASPATSFTLNWLLRVGAIPPGVNTARFRINGGLAATVDHLEQVALSFYGTATDNQTALFTAPPLPIGKVLVLPVFGNPVPTAWTVCGQVLCNAPVGIPLTFNVFYLDTTMTKPNGNFAIVKSNTSSLTVNPNPAGCGFCFGQADDGAFDGFVFRVANPSGSNDWFNVKQGTPSAASGVNTLTGVEIATWDFCGTGGTGSWAEVGIYPANFAISTGGGLPDIGNPLATVGGATGAPVPAGIADWGYPALLMDTADVAANTTTVYHTALSWNQGDSCIWQASDSTATGPDPCGVLPNSSSFSSPDGYTATAGFASSINWMQKLDWQ